jgi:hypothetical protein
MEPARAQRGFESPTGGLPEWKREVPGEVPAAGAPSLDQGRGFDASSTARSIRFVAMVI